MFRESRAKVSTSLTNVSGLVVTELILYTAPCLSSGPALPLSLLSSRHKVVIGMCATHMFQGCSICAINSEVPLMYSIVAAVTGAEITNVSPSVGTGVTVSVPSNKVHVVVVFP